MLGLADLRFLLEQPRLPKPEETVDENGIITVVEYSVNDEGRKVKVSSE